MVSEWYQNVSISHEHWYQNVPKSVKIKIKFFCIKPNYFWLVLLRHAGLKYKQCDIKKDRKSVPKIRKKIFDLCDISIIHAVSLCVLNKNENAFIYCLYWSTRQTKRVYAFIHHWLPARETTTDFDWVLVLFSSLFWFFLKKITFYDTARNIWGITWYQSKSMVSVRYHKENTQFQNPVPCWTSYCNHH